MFGVKCKEEEEGKWCEVWFGLLVAQRLRQVGGKKINSDGCGKHYGLRVWFGIVFSLSVLCGIC